MINMFENLGQFEYFEIIVYKTINIYDKLALIN